MDRYGLEGEKLFKNYEVQKGRKPTHKLAIEQPEGFLSWQEAHEARLVRPEMRTQLLSWTLHAARSLGGTSGGSRVSVGANVSWVIQTTCDLVSLLQGLLQNQLSTNS